MIMYKFKVNETNIIVDKISHGKYEVFIDSFPYSYMYIFDGEFINIAYMDSRTEPKRYLLNYLFDEVCKEHYVKRITAFLRDIHLNDMIFRDPSE